MNQTLLENLKEKIKLYGISLEDYNSNFANFLGEFKLPYIFRKINKDYNIELAFYQIANSVFIAIDNLINQKASITRKGVSFEEWVGQIGEQRAQNLKLAIYEEIKYRTISNQFPELANIQRLSINSLSVLGEARDFSIVEQLLSPIASSIIYNSYWENLESRIEDFSEAVKNVYLKIETFNQEKEVLENKLKELFNSELVTNKGIIAQFRQDIQAAKDKQLQLEKDASLNSEALKNKINILERTQNENSASFSEEILELKGRVEQEQRDRERDDQSIEAKITSANQRIESLNSLANSNSTKITNIERRETTTNQKLSQLEQNLNTNSTTQQRKLDEFKQETESRLREIQDARDLDNINKIEQIGTIANDNTSRIDELFLDMKGKIREVISETPEQFKGATGPQGPQGLQGIQGIPGEKTYWTIFLNEVAKNFEIPFQGQGIYEIVITEFSGWAEEQLQYDKRKAHETKIYHRQIDSNNKLTIFENMPYYSISMIYDDSDNTLKIATPIDASITIIKIEKLKDLNT